MCGHPDSDHRPGKYSGGCIARTGTTYVNGGPRPVWCPCTRENAEGRAEAKRAGALWNAHLGRSPEKADPEVPDA
jgi:hypothetical protein